MDSPSVCYIANCAINNSLEGHNIASIRIIEAAIKAGIISKVVTLENKRTYPKKDFYPIKTRLNPNRRTTIFPSLWEVLSSLPAMLTSKKTGCHIIHLLNVTKEVLLFNKMLVRSKNPCITHFYHSSFPFHALPSFKVRSLLLKLGVFDYILSSNRSLADYLISDLGIETGRVHVVPYPVNVYQFKPMDKQKLRQKYGVPEDMQIITYVGSIDEDRGFFSLLKSFKKVIKQVPNAMLHIWHPGRSRQMSIVVNNFLSNLAIRDRIIIGGLNPHIEEAFAMADVVALPFQKPYWITAPPLVLLEAMASATPIVTTPVDVIKEIGADMMDMIFTAPNDLGSLVNGIVYALENEDEARDIGRRAREKAIKNFSMQVVGEKLRETYKKIYDCKA